MLNFHKLAASDASAYYSLGRRLAGPMNLMPTSVSKAHQEIMRPGSLGYFLKEDGRPFGIITLIVMPGHLLIDRVGTFPGFERKGIATEALRYVLSQHRETTQVDALLHPYDEAATKLFAKLGFTLSTRLDARIHDYLDTGQVRDWYDWTERAKLDSILPLTGEVMPKRRRFSAQQ